MFGFVVCEAWCIEVDRVAAGFEAAGIKQRLKFGCVYVPDGLRGWVGHGFLVDFVSSTLYLEPSCVRFSL